MKLLLNKKAALCAGVALFGLLKAVGADDVRKIQVNGVSSVWDGLPQAEYVDTLHATAEGGSSVIYRARVNGSSGSPVVWTLPHLNGRAYIYVDGELAGQCAGRGETSTITLPRMESSSAIEIFVAPVEGSTSGGTGMSGVVDFTTDGSEKTVQTGWRLFTLPSTGEFVTTRDYSGRDIVEGPTYYRAVVSISEPKDVYLSVTNWGEGEVYLNGRNVGNYVRSDRVVSLPAEFQNKGENELILFDYTAPALLSMEVVSSPEQAGGEYEGPTGKIRSVLPMKVEEDFFVTSGKLTSDGWQETYFSKAEQARYVAFEFCGEASVSIAEVRLIGPGLTRESKHEWQIAEVTSEILGDTPQPAENIFDNDETTQWQSSDEGKGCQRVVIDLKRPYSLAGFQILAAPGNRDVSYRVFVF